jgi:hypothetical protein
MKHTSAPWIVLKPSTGVDNNWHVTDANDTFVAHVYGFGHAVDEQSRINARLIAAAPDLLEALQGIFAANATEGAPKSSHTGHRPSSREWQLAQMLAYKKAAAAIAKATGEKND